MKNISLFLFLSAILLISSCAKCYKCHNVCKVCYKYRQLNAADTVLTILVRSDLLTQKYFVEYIDSLTSPALGWVCNDTISTVQEKFCESEQHNAINLINKRNAGMVCAPE